MSSSDSRNDNVAAAIMRVFLDRVVSEDSCSSWCPPILPLFASIVVGPLSLPMPLISLSLLVKMVDRGCSILTECSSILAATTFKRKSVSFASTPSLSRSLSLLVRRCPASKSCCSSCGSSFGAAAAAAAISRLSFLPIFF